MSLRLIPEIHRAAHRIGLYLDDVSELGVPQAEAHILAHLAAYGDSTIGDLHRAFAHKRSTLTSILDRLDQQKLIRRESHAEDRRTFVISLTGQGKKLARQVHDELEALEAAALQGLSKAEVALVTRVLNAVSVSG